MLARRLAFRFWKSGPEEILAFEAILNEVDQLNQAGDRIEGLAEHHPPVSDALISIAGNVRAAATVLAVLVETKLRNRDGRGKPI